MKLGLAMEEYQDLQMHLNLRSDFTGNLVKITNMISSGRSRFVLRRRIIGVPFSYGTSSNERHTQRDCACC